MRVLHIFRVLGLCIGYRLDALFLQRFAAPSTYLAPFLWRKHWRQVAAMDRGMRVRLALEHMGPIWVKFGQLMSTRHDVFPVDVIQSLALLQDAVTPFSEVEAESMIRNELQYSFEEVFEDFVKQPLASASVAQVHSARLKKEGTDVVIKILRPGIHRCIKRDIGCLSWLAGVVTCLTPDADRLKPKEVVAELARTLKAELNLMTEAANATTLKRNFPETKPLFIPKVYWDYTTEKMMVLERISGVNVDDIETLTKHQVDMKKLAESGVELFFTQVLRDSFFHADLHPGNVFIDITQPDDPSYVLVDFGIVGTLNPEDQRYIAENLLAFFNRDYRRVALLHVESGWVPAQTRIDQFESALRTVCEPIFARPLKDISFGLLFLQLLRTARAFKTEIQPQLILLQKTLLSVESLGRRLYPELNLWETAHPQLEAWVKAQVGLHGFWQKSQDRLPIWLEHIPELPEMVYHWLSRQKSLPVPKELPNTTVSNTPWLMLCLSAMLGCCIGWLLLLIYL